MCASVCLAIDDRAINGSTGSGYILPTCDRTLFTACVLVKHLCGRFKNGT